MHVSGGKCFMHCTGYNRVISSSCWTDARRTYQLKTTGEDTAKRPKTTFESTLKCMTETVTSRKSNNGTETVADEDDDDDSNEGTETVAGWKPRIEVARSAAKTQTDNDKAPAKKFFE